jgi:hypothetical protein
MAGCVKLFPVSPVAAQDWRLREKMKRYAKEGWKLGRADQIAVDTIEAYYRGETCEADALLACDAAKRAGLAARMRRGRR